MSQFVLGKGHTLVCMLMRVDTGISIARDTRVKTRRSVLVSGVLPAATCRPPGNKNASSQTSFSTQSHSGPAIYGLCAVSTVVEVQLSWKPPVQRVNISEVLSG